MFKFIEHFRHWILREQLEPDHKQPMPQLVVLWPDVDTMMRAHATMMCSDGMRELHNHGRRQPINVPIEGIPMETMQLHGVPVTFAALDGKQLVAIRAWKGKKRHA